MRKRWFVAFWACMAFACGRKQTAETYPKGQPKLVREYSLFGAKDSLHWKKVTAYYFNGKPEFEARYRAGLRDGEYRGYWQNGQIEAKGLYVAGKRQGDWEFYYNQYTLSAKGRYRDDWADGEWIEYWENGELKRRGVFRAGREIGEWLGWNKRGAEILRSSCYADNPSGHYRSYHDNGAVKEEYACRDSTHVGAYLENHPDGSLKTRGFYDSSGAKDSLWETFHPDGRIFTRQRFVAGLWTDSVLGWDDSGRVIERGFFRKGTGVLSRYDSLGRLVETAPMDSGREDGEHWKYYPGGRKRMLMRFQKGAPLSYARWHPDGRPAADGFFTEGKKSGLWREWDGKGKLRESSHFEAGLLHGERRFFDSTGALVRLQKYFRGLPTEGAFPGIPGGVKAPKTNK